MRTPFLNRKPGGGPDGGIPAGDSISIPRASTSVAYPVEVRGATLHAGPAMRVRMNRTKVNLFLRYLAITLIPIFVLVATGTISIVINDRYVTRQIRESSSRTLEQIRNSVDFTFAELDSLDIIFSSSSEFLAALGRILSSPDLDLEESKLLSVLQNFVNVSAFARRDVESIYVYIQNDRDRFMTSTDGIVDLSGYSDRDWYLGYLSHAEDDASWTETRVLNRLPVGRGGPAGRHDLPPAVPARRRAPAGRGGAQHPPAVLHRAARPDEGCSRPAHRHPRRGRLGGLHRVPRRGRSVEGRRDGRGGAPHRDCRGSEVGRRPARLAPLRVDVPLVHPRRPVLRGFPTAARHQHRGDRPGRARRHDRHVLRVAAGFPQHRGRAGRRGRGREGRAAALGAGEDWPWLQPHHLQHPPHLPRAPVPACPDVGAALPAEDSRAPRPPVADQPPFPLQHARGDQLEGHRAHPRTEPDQRHDQGPLQHPQVRAAVALGPRDARATRSSTRETTCASSESASRDGSRSGGTSSPASSSGR